MVRWKRIGKPPVARGCMPILERSRKLYTAYQWQNPGFDSYRMQTDKLMLRSIFQWIEESMMNSKRIEEMFEKLNTRKFEITVVRANVKDVLPYRRPKIK